MQAEAEADDGVHRSLGHGVPGQFAILGIPPGPFAAVDLFQATGPLVDADHEPGHGIRRWIPSRIRPAVLRGDRAVDQEPARPLVVSHRPALGLVVGGMADLVAQDVEVVVEDEAPLSCSPKAIGDDAPADQAAGMLMSAR